MKKLLIAPVSLGQRKSILRSNDAAVEVFRRPLRNAACALALLRTALLAPLRASGRTSLTSALESFAQRKFPQRLKRKINLSPLF